MATGPETLLQYIRRLVIAPEADSDAALLGRFISAKDERAFTALIDRHGALVLQVCQRILGDVHDAEDAFQAVFLVLARKAAAVQPREALAAWLHGVARRVALKARSVRARQVREAQSPAERPADPHADPLSELSGRELVMTIDEELRRLPKAYRLAVIVCCLQGRSLEEAARQLGWTRGSVKGRLERGRARLHERLVRRGLTLSAVLAAAEVSRGKASAVTVSWLLARTVRGAVAFAAHSTAGVEGVSARATALAGDILKGMALAKLKLAAAFMLATCLLATGFAMYPAALSPSTPAPKVRSSPLPLQDEVARAGRPAPVNRRTTEPRDESNMPIEVSGRVLDPMGKPLAGANLYVGYSVHRFTPDVEASVQSRQVSYRRRATSEVDGQFHFTFTTSELDARGLDDWRPAVIAVADGYGPDWAEVVESDKSRQLSLKLVEDLPVTGRILDPNNKPVAGAKVLICNVLSDSEEGVDRYFQGQINAWYPRIWRGPFPEQPPAVTTDGDGRFRLTGLGRDRIVTLTLDGPAIRHTALTAAVRPSTALPKSWWGNGATFEYKASPSQSIRGVVRDKATGRPVAGVRMGTGPSLPPAFTDDNGRFEILGCPKMAQGYAVMAQPQAGQPYFAAKSSAPDRPSFDPVTVDLELVSGISLSGRVTDRATGKPPRAAVMEYYPLFPNAHSSKLTHCPGMAASSALIRHDGSYSLVVLPGPGVVCVAASPRNSYAVAMLDDKELANFLREAINHSASQGLNTSIGDRGHLNLNINKYNALSLINPDEKAEASALDVTLEPGRTLQGTVAGPDAMPLTRVEVIGLTAMPDEEMLGNSSFTVRGLNARSSRELVFRHREKGLGKVLTIRGDETGPLTVRLEPCGSVLGRLVDKEGKPVPGVNLVFSRSGQSFDFTDKTDREGRFRGVLLPGQKYGLSSWSSRRLLKETGELEVESGRIKDLGDLPLSD